MQRVLCVAVLSFTLAWKLIAIDVYI